jgi:hypothetical protein
MPAKISNHQAIGAVYRCRPVRSSQLARELNLSLSMTMRHVN